MQLSQLKESRDSRENVAELSREDVKNVELLKEYYNNSPDEEKKKLVEEFEGYVNSEVSKLPKLNNSFEIKESNEIGNNDLENLEAVKSFISALNNYPDISQKERKAIDNMVYGLIKGAQEQVEDIINNRKKSDKTIEL